MSDVFNEVDEELRRDKTQELFTRYRPLMIAVTLAIVLGVSGYKGLEYYQAQEQSRAAEGFNHAATLLQVGDVAAAEAAYAQFSKDGPKGYAALALMEQAAIKAQTGKPAEAAQLYSQAADAFSDPLYKDLATLRAVLVVADSLELADLEAKLSLLTGPGRPFRFTARELLAAKAFEEGNLNRAREDYTYLSMALDAPSGARNRAAQALAVLGPAPKEAQPQAVQADEESTQ